MKRTIPALAVAAALLALAGPSLAGTTDRDYGPLPIPADAPEAALTTWWSCTDDHQEVARNALRFGCGDYARCSSYFSAPGHGEDEERIDCFWALIEVLGGQPLFVDPHYASDGVRWERHPKTGEWVEEEGPLGYRVVWDQRTDGCQATVWGVLGPPKDGTPWYLLGAPSMRLPCPAARAGGGS